MRTKLSIICLFCVLSLALQAADAPKGFVTDRLVLYQPNDVLAARVPVVENLASYSKALEAVCVEFFARSGEPEALNVVVIVRPGKRSRVWFVTSKHPADLPERNVLRKKLEAVEPCAVTGGPVAFAIAGSVAGGGHSAENKGEGFQPPMPQAWKDATRKQGRAVVIPDGFIDIVWPENK